MGEKPTEADEAAGQREAGSGMATGIAIEEEGVQRVRTADMDADGIAVEEEGIQRTGEAITIKQREGTADEGGELDSNAIEGGGVNTGAHKRPGPA